MTTRVAKAQAPEVITPFFTAAEVARYLKVSLLTVDHMVRDGRLTPHYLGPRIRRFHIDEVNAAMGLSA